MLQSAKRQCGLHYPQYSEKAMYASNTAWEGRFEGHDAEHTESGGRHSNKIRHAFEMNELSKEIDAQKQKLRRLKELQQVHASVQHLQLELADESTDIAN